jgi:hypothetical protein
MAQIGGLEFAPGSILDQIGDWAFGDTQLGGELTIPSSVTRIGEYAFNGAALSGLTIDPKGQLETIGTGAFVGLSGVTGALTLPESVYSVGCSVLEGSGYTKVVFLGQLPSLTTYPELSFPADFPIEYVQEQFDEDLLAEWNDAYSALVWTPEPQPEPQPEPEPEIQPDDDTVDKTPADPKPSAPAKPSVTKIRASATTVLAKASKSGKTSTVKLPLVAYGKTVGKTADKAKLAWSTSNKAIASVAKGKKAGQVTVTLGKATKLPLVIGKKAGSATITLKADGVTYKVTVKVVSKTVKATKITFALTKSAKSAGVTAKGLKAKAPKATVKATGKPFRVKTKTTATGVVPVWTSSNPKVATVDATGRVTAKAPGTAKVTVKLGAKTRTLTLKVK